MLGFENLFHAAPDIVAAPHATDGRFLFGAALDLANAKRQLIKIHLPGDVLGTTSMCLDRAGETLEAVPLGLDARRETGRVMGAARPILLERFASVLPLTAHTPRPS